MLKKALTVLAVAATALSVQAKETITVINPSNKASPGTVFAKSFEESLRKNGKYDVEFYQASSCADADAKYAKSPNSVMVYSTSVGIAAKDKNLSCNFAATPNNTTLITKSYLKFCRKSGSNKAFGEGKTTLGVASVILSQGLIDDLNDGKRKLVGVPYSGSKTVLAALMAGDIEYGIIGSGIVNEPEARKEIECIYDYNPKSKNFIGKTFTNLKVPTLPIIQLIHTNAGAGVVQAVTGASRDAGFSASIQNNGFTDTKSSNINQQDIEDVKKYVNDVYNFYWKK
jgi:hypothetical protein